MPAALRTGCMLLVLVTLPHLAWGQTGVLPLTGGSHTALRRAEDRVSVRVRDGGYDLIDIDTLLYVENRGLTRLLVEFNGQSFKLAADPAEVHRSANAYLIPRFGAITVSIAAYAVPGGPNYMEVVTQGPAGSSADLIIGDLLLPGQEVAYAVQDLQPVPGRSALLQAYPNPFADATTVTYDVSADRLLGVPVHLAVYDVSGRRVSVLVDGLRYPGRFTVTWNGAGDGAGPVAGGLYFCQLVLGDMRRTISLVRVR